MTNAEGNAAFNPGDVRVGDAERNAAISALGEHLASGRLDIDEYGTRSAQITNARTDGELQALFSDLPGPHPGVLQPSSSHPLAATAGTSGAVVNRSRTQQLAAAVAGASGIIAVILFFVLQNVWSQAWLVFLLVPLGYGLANSVWGPDWKNDHDRNRNRNRNRDR